MELLTWQQKVGIGQTCAHANLKQAVRWVTTPFDRYLQPHGLNATQFALLAASSLAGPTPLGELAEVLTLDQTSLSRSLRVLQREGLMMSVPEHQDARVRLISVTPEGEARLAAAYPAWQRAQHTVTQGLSSQEYQVLLGLLMKLQTADA